ncbi:MAG: sugar nucleotide-binding protein, partial [Planctomycetia bacterium]|nr:sugar nucleotide-binding protein [Planctomycetia bacterium]
ATVTTTAIRRLAGGEGELPASGIYHLTASGATSWHGLAELVVDAARTAGLPMRVTSDRIRPIPSSAWPQAARRPANSRLDTARLRCTFDLTLPPWQDDVRPVVATLIPQATRE